MDIRAILATISEHLDTTGRAPTIKQLAEHLECSVGTTHGIVTNLVERGYLELAGPYRTITLTESALILIERI